MQVSVETLNGLERKVTVSVPSEKVEEEVALRLKDLARKVKLDGFRPGKVPFHLVKTRYSAGVREEVAREMVQSTLFEALKQNDINAAGMPHITPEQVERDKDFIYSALVEVFPVFSINELGKIEVQVIESSVTDADVDVMLEKLLDQNKNWEEVTRSAEKGDKVTVDFKGFLNDEPFEGGQASEYEVEIGAGQMIPGFEDGLIGHAVGDEFKMNVKFPDNYGHKDLAGKDSVFEIKIHRIKHGVRPELNDAFAEKFNVKSGGVDALRKDLRANMSRELARRLSSINRERIFDKMIEKNTFDVPNALINQEIEHLKHEMYHRIVGPHHSENEKIPDFPRELFEAQAKRRVHLGLLCSEYVKKHELNVDKARVDAMIDKLAEAYDSPDELKKWYQEDKTRIAEIEALVMEEMVSEKMLEDATVVKEVMDYEALMALSQAEANTGAM